MEIIPELNQFLAVFATEEKIEIHCQNQMEIKQLTGIFLIKENACKIIYQGQELIFQEKSYGSPLLINTPKLKFIPGNHPKFNIELEKLHFDAPSINPMSPVENKPTKNYFIPNFWTIILYPNSTSTYLSRT